MPDVWLYNDVTLPAPAERLNSRPLGALVMEASLDKDYSSRRIFVTEGESHFQILDFTQNKGDGSIYVSAPNFAQIRWVGLATKQEVPVQVFGLDSAGGGKLSLHGSGMAAISPHVSSSGHSLVVHGNFLLKEDKLGVRHLFTLFLAEPTTLPVSPAFNRKSDYSIMISKPLCPYVLVFFALPKGPDMSLQVQASFQIDDLQTVPPESGFGHFPLPLHNIGWFAYRTKHMARWPKAPHVCFFDGFVVPIFVGVGEGTLRVEPRSPTYELSAKAVKVSF